MSGKLLLDTNIIVALFRNDENVRNKLNTSPEVFVSAVAIGELYFGANRSARVKKNIDQIREFAENSIVLPCDVMTAEHYGQIKNGLKKKGRPLPENDIWIAAIAKQYSLTVVTRDEHFKEIEKLSLVEW